jgi:hypothetical protein
MWTGVQATEAIGAGQSQLYFTWGWPADWHVLWHVMSDTATSGAPSLDWQVAVERSNQTQCTYWITVKNLTSVALTFELRFAVLS